MDVDLILSDFSVAFFFQSQNTRQHEKQKYLRDWQYLNQHSKMEKQLLLQNFCRISLKSHSSGLDSHPTTLRFSLPSLDVITSGFPFESCRYRYYILTNINNTYSFSYMFSSLCHPSPIYIYIYLLLNLVFFVSPKTSPWMKPRAQWSPWHEDHKDSTMRDAPLKSSRVQSCSPSAAVDPRCILLHTCGVFNNAFFWGLYVVVGIMQGEAPMDCSSNHSLQLKSHCQAQYQTTKHGSKE